MNKNYVQRFIEHRNTVYENSLRGKMIFFREYIHDLVRAGKVKKLTSPLSVYWAITSHCNLSCRHCYVGDRIINDDLPLDDCIDILKILKNMNVFDLTFEGGEPFMRDDMAEIIGEAKKQGFVVDILTNGTQITEHISQQLESCMNHEIDRIQISIDGSKTCNDIIRGRGSYDRAKDAINMLKWLPNITVNTVVTRDNLSSLKEMCEDLIKTTDVKVIHLSPLMKIGKGSSSDYPDTEEAMKTFLDLQDMVGSKVVLSGTPIPDRLLFRDDNYNKYISPNMKNQLTLGCCGGRSKLYIDENGFASRCEFLKSQNNMSIKINDDFLKYWSNTWSEDIENTYKLSRQMSNEKTYRDYCPLMIENN